MQISNFSVHHVESITTEQKQFPGFWSIDITITGKDGSTATVTTYSDRELTIDGFVPALRVIGEEEVAA